MNEGNKAIEAVLRGSITKQRLAPTSAERDNAVVSRSVQFMRSSPFWLGVFGRFVLQRC